MNPVETKYHDLLRHSERTLTPDIRADLSKARQAALAASSRRTGRHFGWLPFSGVALASLVAVVLVWPEVRVGNDTRTQSDPLITENLEMYQNLDFYHWLGQQGFSNNG